MTTYGTAALTALGDPTRRAILEALADRPRPVGELARDLPVSRPAVSQHLKVLKQSGLVVVDLQYDPDPAHASEFEVRFVTEGTTSTRVELEHRGFERHGATADAVFGIVDSPNGWTHCLALFAKQTDA